MGTVACFDARSYCCAGGPIAQLAVRYPEVTVTVNDADLSRSRRRTATSARCSAARGSEPAHRTLAAPPSPPGRPARSATLRPMSGHPVLELFLGDVVRLRRRHPCGGDTWLIDRLGADIGLRCETCARHVLIERPVAGAAHRRVRAPRGSGPERSRRTGRARDRARQSCPSPSGDERRPEPRSAGGASPAHSRSSATARSCCSGSASCSRRSAATWSSSA